MSIAEETVIMLVTKKLVVVSKTAGLSWRVLCWDADAVFSLEVGDVWLDSE